VDCNCKVVPAAGMGGFIAVRTSLGTLDNIYYAIKTIAFRESGYRYTFIRVYPCVYGFKYDHDSELIYSEIIYEL
jgi:hypothetical protein